MIYDSSTIIANITRVVNEHHNNNANHHMIRMIHTQIHILGEYWIQNMKNEKWVVVVNNVCFLFFHLRYSY
jgi:hypothetical protein